MAKLEEVESERDQALAEAAYWQEKYEALMAVCIQDGGDQVRLHNLGVMFRGEFEWLMATIQVAKTEKWSDRAVKFLFDQLHRANVAKNNWLMAPPNFVGNGCSRNAWESRILKWNPETKMDE